VLSWEELLGLKRHPIFKFWEMGKIMRVAICCKGVPINTRSESVSIVNGDIHYKDTDFYINEFDAYALEAALLFKNLYKAETIALTVGPLRAQEVLYIALAKGIDRVLRIDGETSRPEFIAAGLISALKEINPQLILVGVQSEDWMGAEVGVYLSQAFNIGLAYAVIEICELKDTHIRIKKEIGGGRKAETLLKLPAILCVQSGIQPLRYVSAIKRQKARNHPIKLWGKLDLGNVGQTINWMGAYEITDVAVPSREGHAEMITGDRTEMATRLLEIVTKAI
jgi:electron transfer flavoprotein beta subunit